MDSRWFGFKLRECVTLHDWKVLDLDESVPIEHDFNCPIHSCALETLSTLVSIKSSGKIRSGCCPRCGYFGFIDRPKREWLAEFYSHMWDSGREKVGAAPNCIEAVRHGRLSEITVLLERLNIDKSRYLCDIGCGDGQTLEDLRSVGFNKLVGVENSEHRARLCRARGNVDVISAPFERDSTQMILSRYAPFSVMIFYHVIEHLYDPAEAIRLASSLQSDGDYLIIGVPNLSGEPSLKMLLYFPHLHVFSRSSLMAMLERFKYEVVDDSLIRKRSITMVARKRKSENRQNTRTEENVKYKDFILQKIATCLELGIPHRSPLRWLWVYRAFDVGGQIKVAPKRFLWELQRFALSHLSRYLYPQRVLVGVGAKRFWKRQPIQSFIVSDLERRFTPFDDSPVEIQFEGDIKLFYK